MSKGGSTMQPNSSVLVACRLSRSGFSGERVYRVTLADGKTEHVGVAPVHYCRTAKREPIGRDQPSSGNQIDGLIEGLLVENGGDEADVAMPDGETIRVNVDQIRFRMGDPQYVPMQSGH
jgi:hypothetical protein